MKRFKVLLAGILAIAACGVIALPQAAFAADKNDGTYVIDTTTSSEHASGSVSDQAPQIEIHKVDRNGNAISGAIFQLHECDKEGNYTSEVLAQWKSGETPAIFNGATDTDGSGKKWLEPGHYYALTEVSAADDTYTKVPGDIIFTFDKNFAGELRIINGGNDNSSYIKDGVTYATAVSGEANSTSGDVTITSWDINVYNDKKDSVNDVERTEHGEDTVNRVKRNKEGMAQTSDLFNPAVTGVIVLVGAALVILGIKSRRKKDEPLAEAAADVKTAQPDDTNQRDD